MVKQEFTTLKKHLWRKTLVVLAAAVFGVIMLRALLLGIIGDHIVALIQRFAPIDDTVAFQTYRTLIQKNSVLLLSIALVAVGIILHRVLVKDVVKQFNHILRSLDSVAKDEPLSNEHHIPELTQQIQVLQQSVAQKEHFAKEAEQRKDDLVVYLAHDIRTPLTTIIGYLTLLAETPNLTPEQRSHYTQLVLAKAYKLEELTNELFDITRFNLQEIPYRESTVNITLLLEQLVEEFNYLGTERQIRVVLKEAPPTVTLTADSFQLARAISNILKNAIQHGREQSEVQVALLQEEAGIRIEIANEGSTIPPEIQERIFDKFYRLDHSRSGQSGGSGLGLAIAAEIIKVHRGTIRVQSETGLTTFILQLPFLRKT